MQQPSQGEIPPAGRTTVAALEDTRGAQERRHSFRVRSGGQASVWRSSQLLGHYEIEDLCLQGCSLRRSATCMRDSGCAEGDHVELLLHLPNATPFWLTAEVRRSSAGNLALRFGTPSARLEDRLQDLIVETYARSHAGAGRLVLVVEPRAAHRGALLQQLAELGQAAVGVPTPLDAVQLLVERGNQIEVALVGPRLGDDTPGIELSDFLATAYPHIHRVLTGSAHELSEAWLAEATGEVDALLETPCAPDTLRRLIQRISSLPHDA